MAKRFQFDEIDNRENDRRKTTAPQCLACEEMLTDALDGGLEAADQAWFDQHVGTCANCSEVLADAKRGAAWLDMLKTPRPEPSARLMERILAQTSGVAGEVPSGVYGEATRHTQMVPSVLPSVLPVGVPGNVLAFAPRPAKGVPWANLGWRGVRFEPRLAMTAAMAFFSIALTLNLTGVQLNRLHVSNLKPWNLKHTYYAANAGAARYYDNLRVVRVLESRVEDFREASADRAVTPAEQRKEESKPQPRQDLPGTSPQAPAGKQGEENKKPGVGPGMSRQSNPPTNPESLKSRPEMSRTGEPVASVSKLHEAGGLG